MPIPHAQPNTVSSPASDSEDSAPEFLTLSSAKKSSRIRDEAVHAFGRAQKERRKQVNRERNTAVSQAKAKALAERKTAQMVVEEEEEEEGRVVFGKAGRLQLNAKGKGKETVSDVITMEALSAVERMERAMREAAEENLEDDDDDDMDDANNDLDQVDDNEDVSNTSDDADDAMGEDQWHGISDTQHPFASEEWSGTADEDTDIDSPPATTTLAPSKHLPDHLFSAAARTPLQVPSNDTPASKKDKSSTTPRKKRTHKTKDLFVGSRAIRTLTPLHAETLTASLTLPPPRINKFLKRALHLKHQTNTAASGKNANTNRNDSDGTDHPKRKRHATQRWERRPVHLGVLRHTTGPAMRFARSATMG